MKKKILNFILLILLLITLVSCDLFKLDKNKKSANDIFVDYESTSIHEKLVIDNYELIKDTTVSLVNINDPKISVGSAVIYKNIKENSDNIFYALTTAKILTENLNELSVLIGKKTLSEKIIAYAYNEKNNIGIIKFKSEKTLKIAQFLKDDLLKVEVGQNISSIGTVADLNDFLTFKTGMITNIIEDDKFTHDASLNAGEIGTGVFSLDGKLIGLNIEKKIKIPGDNSDVFGVNIAFNIAAIAEKLMEIEVDGKNITIKDNVFSNSFLTKENKYSDYEKELRKIYNNENIKNSIVTIRYDYSQITGIVYEKINNKKYSILTVWRESLNEGNCIFSIGGIDFTKKDKIENFEFKRLKTSEKVMIIEIEFKDEQAIEVFHSSAIEKKKGIDLIQGQKLLTFAEITGLKYNHFFNQAVLSKKDLSAEIFLHDGKLNLGQEGAPIFNLKGELVGINAGRDEHITTSTGTVMLEGINYAYNINFLAPQINDRKANNVKKLKVLDEDKYEATNEYEAKIISAVNKTYDKMVTVAVDEGHGSGIIFKKEKTDKNTYIYSLLTNEHVIGNGFDVTINFNNTSNYVTAYEYRKTKELDISVVKFESENEYDVLNVDALENKPLRKIKVGQIVIAIGTPIDSNLNGYVTVGNMASEPKNYQKITNLGLNHDAAINPGNSGGPLIDLNGDLIGINVSKTLYITTKKGNILAERISTSLNINVLKNTINEYNSYIYSKTAMVPRLGVRIIALDKFIESNPILNDDNLLDEFKKKEGIIITGIDEKRIAYKNLQENDIIIEIDENKIDTITAMINALGKIKIGDKHKFKILRFNKLNNTFDEIVKDLTIK